MNLTEKAHLYTTLSGTINRLNIQKNDGVMTEALTNLAKQIKEEIDELSTKTKDLGDEIPL